VVESLKTIMLLTNQAHTLNLALMAMMFSSPILNQSRLKMRLSQKGCYQLKSRFRMLLRQDREWGLRQSEIMLTHTFAIFDAENGGVKSIAIKSLYGAKLGVNVKKWILSAERHAQMKRVSVEFQFHINALPLIRSSFKMASADVLNETIQVFGILEY